MTLEPATESFTIEGAQGWLDDFQTRLETTVPCPYGRTLELGRDYTSVELENLLQTFGAHLANLFATEGRIKAECHLLKEGYKNGMRVAVARHGSLADTTVSGREGQILSENESFRNVLSLLIKNEAALELIEGWRRAYDQAYASTSRIVALQIGEMNMQSGRTL